MAPDELDCEVWVVEDKSATSSRSMYLLFI